MKKILLLILLPFFVHAQTQQELSIILAASSQDFFVTGQGSQLAANQNILLATSGTTAMDAVSGGTVSYASVYIQITPAAGTVTAGVVTFECSSDNFTSTAMPLFLYDMGSATAAPVSSVTLVAATTRYFGGAIPYKYVRARISTAITGTTTGVQAFARFSSKPFVPIVNIIAQPTAANLNVTAVQATAANFNTTAVQGAAGANSWLFEQRTGTTNGSTSTSQVSLASTNATSVKASAGMLYCVMAQNTSASIRYVRFFNKASAPTVGTDVPVFVLVVPAGASKEVWFPMGIKFSTGIALAETGAAPSNDATAVSAGDIVLFFNWQ